MLDALTQRLSTVVKTLRGHARITEENVQEMLREVRLALLDADAGLPVVKDFVAHVKERALGQEVVGSVTPGQARGGIVYEWRVGPRPEPPRLPAGTLYVAAAMQGPHAVNAAKPFGDARPLPGIVLTKLDGDARGGAALSVRHVTGKPIKFVGVSEKLDGLEAFDPARMANRVLGMGDILALVEEARKGVDMQAATDMANKIKSGGKFD